MPEIPQNDTAPTVTRVSQLPEDLQQKALAAILSCELLKDVFIKHQGNVSVGPGTDSEEFQAVITQLRRANLVERAQEILSTCSARLVMTEGERLVSTDGHSGILNNRNQSFIIAVDPLKIRTDVAPNITYTLEPGKVLGERALLEQDRATDVESAEGGSFIIVVDHLDQWMSDEMLNDVKLKALAKGALRHANTALEMTGGDDKSISEPVPFGQQSFREFLSTILPQELTMPTAQELVFNAFAEIVPIEGHVFILEDGIVRAMSEDGHTTYKRLQGPTILYTTVGAGGEKTGTVKAETAARGFYLPLAAATERHPAKQRELIRIISILTDIAITDTNAKASDLQKEATVITGQIDKVLT